MREREKKRTKRKSKRMCNFEKENERKTIRYVIVGHAQGQNKSNANRLSYYTKSKRKRREKTIYKRGRYDRRWMNDDCKIQERKKERKKQTNKKLICTR